MAEGEGAAGGGPALSLEQLMSLLETMPMEESEREALRDSLARQHAASQRIAAAATGASRLASGPPPAHDMVLIALAATVAFILLFLGYRIYKTHNDTSEESAPKRSQSDETNKKRR